MLQHAAPSPGIQEGPSALEGKIRRPIHNHGGLGQQAGRGRPMHEPAGVHWRPAELLLMPDSPGSHRGVAVAIQPGSLSQKAASLPAESMEGRGLGEPPRSPQHPRSTTARVSML